MAQWQRTLRLQPEWRQSKDGEIAVQKLAAVIAKRLAALRPFGEGIGRTIEDFDDQRDDLVDQFADFAKDPTGTTDEFDGIMSDLYDWGDQSMDAAWNGKKVCWIDTIGAGAPASLPEGPR